MCEYRLKAIVNDNDDRTKENNNLIQYESQIHEISKFIQYNGIDFIYFDNSFEC